MDEIYCIFLGNLNNLYSLIKQYGLSKGTNEAMFVIEAYRTLRDRGPYPADQVLKDMDGSFGFVVYDNEAKTVFAALVIILNINFLLELAVLFRFLNCGGCMHVFVVDLKNKFICLRSNSLFGFINCRVQMKKLDSSGA